MWHKLRTLLMVGKYWQLTNFAKNKYSIDNCKNSGNIATYKQNISITLMQAYNIK